MKRWPTISVFFQYDPKDWDCIEKIVMNFDLEGNNHQMLYSWCISFWLINFKKSFINTFSWTDRERKREADKKEQARNSCKDLNIIFLNYLTITLFLFFLVECMFFTSCKNIMLSFFCYKFSKNLLIHSNLFFVSKYHFNINKWHFLFL